MKGSLRGLLLSLLVCVCLPQAVRYINQELHPPSMGTASDLSHRQPSHAA